jgi:hypothetical protein
MIFNSSLFTFLKGLLHEIFPPVHGLYILTPAAIFMQLLMFLKEDAVLFYLLLNNRTDSLTCEVNMTLKPPLQLQYIQNSPHYF